MKHRRLPIEQELELVVQDEGEDAAQTRRASYFQQTVNTRGFQLVVAILRNQEQFAMNLLQTQRDDPRYYLGWIHGMNQFKKLLTSLLPEGEQEKVDWADDEEEEFLDIDPSEKASGEGEP